MAKTLYIFLDEGGELNFSPSGSRFFTITSVCAERPFRLHTEIDTYKYDLIEFVGPPRIDVEYFHCANDNKHVKHRIFDILAKNLPNGCADSIIVEKAKTGPALRQPERFYPEMLGYLLRFVISKKGSSLGEVVVITDSIPINNKRKAIEKAVKTTLKGMLPKGVAYRVMHHASKSHYSLQIADYINWALFRKWEHGDDSSYKLISSLFASEFEIFRSGTTNYY